MIGETFQGEPATVEHFIERFLTFLGVGSLETTKRNVATREAVGAIHLTRTTKNAQKDGFSAARAVIIVGDTAKEAVSLEIEPVNEEVGAGPPAGSEEGFLALRGGTLGDGEDGGKARVVLVAETGYVREHHGRCVFHQ